MTTDELKQTFASDEQFHDARQRIFSTETLIIDEVGMLSQLMFEKVELVCRILKNPHLYFGGLQVNILEKKPLIIHIPWCFSFSEYFVRKGFVSGILMFRKLAIGICVHLFQKNLL